MNRLENVLLDQTTGEAAIKWWDRHIKNNPGLLVGCSLLEAFAAGFNAGRKHSAEEMFRENTQADSGIQSPTP